MRIVIDILLSGVSCHIVDEIWIATISDISITTIYLSLHGVR